MEMDKNRLGLLVFSGWPILGNVTRTPLQNLCKQKRSVSRHFFIKLSDVLAFYLA